LERKVESRIRTSAGRVALTPVVKFEITQFWITTVAKSDTLTPFAPPTALMLRPRRITLISGATIDTASPVEAEIAAKTPGFVVMVTDLVMATVPYPAASTTASTAAPTSPR